MTKTLNAVLPATEFNNEVVSWISENSDRLNQAFSKRFPRARNRFNIELKNKEGGYRHLVVSEATAPRVFYRGSYDNTVIRWNTLRRMGCPLNN